MPRRRQIGTRLNERQGQAVTNFARSLPPPESDLAQQIIKDPYQFDFLTVTADAKERDLERALVARVKDVLLEMGKGFAFIGSQHHVEIGGQDWYVDLLFYHRRLRCLIAVDLKIGAFQPEHAGKMNFYLAALDDRERQPQDGPSIGLILCRDRNRVVVEYALRNVSGPIGVAEYRVLIADALPAALAEALPSTAEIESAIGPTEDRSDDETHGSGITWMFSRSDNKVLVPGVVTGNCIMRRAWATDVQLVAFRLSRTGSAHAGRRYGTECCH